jgi:hypothetical protein
MSFTPFIAPPSKGIKQQVFSINNSKRDEPEIPVDEILEGEIPLDMLYEPKNIFNPNALMITTIIITTIALILMTLIKDSGILSIFELNIPDFDIFELGDFTKSSNNKKEKENTYDKIEDTKDKLDRINENYEKYQCQQNQAIFSDVYPDKSPINIENNKLNELLIPNSDGNPCECFEWCANNGNCLGFKYIPEFDETNDKCQFMTTRFTNNDFQSDKNKIYFQKS